MVVYGILGAPEGLKNCSTSNHTENSILVECLEGSDNGVKQTIILELYATKSKYLEKNYTSKSGSFILRGLKSNTDYMALVYAVNEKGASTKLQVPITSVRPLASIKGELHHKIWLWV